MSLLFLLALALALNCNVPHFPFTCRKKLCGISKWEKLALNSWTGAGEWQGRFLRMNMYPQYGAPPEPAGILLVEHVGIWEITKKTCFKRALESKQKKIIKRKSDKTPTDVWLFFPLT